MSDILQQSKDVEFAEMMADLNSASALQSREDNRNEVGQKVEETSYTAQILGGAADAVNETLELVDDVAVSSGEFLGLPEWMYKQPIVPGFEEGDKVYLPTTAPPQTTAQAMTRSMSQFVTGFVGAGKLLKPVQAVSKTGQAVKAASQGAIADFTVFDPHQERLANMLDEHPNLRIPLTDFLRADPSDSNAEGRFKNAIEGLGVGLVADGFIKSIRVMRGVMAGRATNGGKNILEEQSRIFGKLDDDAFSTLGNVKEKSVVFKKLDDAASKTTSDDSSVVSRKLVNNGKKESDEVFINFARIDTGDDIKSVMAQMADTFSKDIDEARRGVVTHDETKVLAETLGMTVDDLLERRKGTPFNAEQALAARQIWTSSTEKLLELAKIVAEPNAGDADRFMFRKMLATHKAIQEEVIAARTETARSLSSWKIPAGGVERAKAVQDMLNAHGGSTVTDELAKRMALFSDDPQGFSTFVEKSTTAATLEAVKESFVLGRLWSPKTHARNIIGNTVTILQSMQERHVAAGISSFLERGAGEGVAFGEAAAMFHGLRSGLLDGFRYAAKAFQTGVTGHNINQIDSSIQKAISSEAFNIKNVPLARAVDMFGEMTRVPGRALAAEDEFFKTVGYRMEVHAQAYRQAVSEGLSGNTDDFTKRVADLVENPPENIRLAASDASLYKTFTNELGDWGKGLMKLRNDANIGFFPVGTLILPYLRTPVNILRYAFERSPIAPLVGQWRDDIAAGGARADIAMARMASGSTIMLVAADLASTGVITGSGPDDIGQREALTRQGWQKHSVKIGDKYYSFSGTDPIGMTLAIAADLQHMVNRYDIEPEEMDEVNEIMGAAIAAVAQSSISKSYFSGVADVVRAIQEPDRYAARYVSDQVEGTFPFISLFGAAENLLDPEYREGISILENVQTRIPILSKKLTVRRDIWGNELGANPLMGNVYNALSPTAVSKIKDSPIDRELVALNHAPTRIKKKISFSTGESGTIGVSINFRQWPKVYEAYVVMAGEASKKYLDAVISGNHPDSAAYQILKDYDGDGRVPSGTREYFITNAISEFRKEARKKIMNDPQFVDFQQHVRELQFKKMQFKE